MKCYVFDIDGTLADLSHRLYYIEGEKKDWRGFFAACGEDKPIPHMVMLARDLRQERPVIFVSGRSNECRHLTERWLRLHLHDAYDPLVYMRPAGDHRPDDQVKRELLTKLREDGWDPIMVFDDRSSVVKMWREAGVPCAQVAEGDF